jgi:uncharacterized protein (UPF0332 family)
MSSSLLHDLKSNGKLQLGNPSAIANDELIDRAEEGIRAAKAITKHPAQAVPAAYFAAYHATQAYFWKLGIRCETHGGSVALLTLLKHHTIAKQLRALLDKRWQAHYGIDLILIEQDAKAAITQAEAIIDELAAIDVDEKTITKAQEHIHKL